MYEILAENMGMPIKKAKATKSNASCTVGVAPDQKDKHLKPQILIWNFKTMTTTLTSQMFTYYKWTTLMTKLWCTF